MAVIRSNRSLVLLLGALCLGATAIAGFGAGRAAPSAEPSSIAVVDIFRLMNSLREIQEDRSELNALTQRYQSEIDEATEKLQQMQQELSELSFSREEELERRVRLEEQREKARLIKSRSDMILAFEENVRTIDRYNKLADAAKRLAEQQGYDLVLVRSDMKGFGPLPDQIAPQKLQEVMLLRQMLYANDAIDITDQLITMMNNEFGAGGNP